MKKRGDLTNGRPDDPSSGGDSEPRPAGLDRATELKLLGAALLENMQAFSELFEHYRPALYGLCCRRLNDFALAEDVVQEVFLKAFKNLPNSDHRKPIWPWLAAIAHRMCIDLQRRRSFIQYTGDIRETTDKDTETNGQTVSALDELMASEHRAEVWKLLDVLPERQRRAFELHEVEGLSCAEIASAEGVSVAAVYRLLFRARRKMRSVRQSGPLPAIVFPFTWLSWKFQRIEERVRPLLGVYGEGLSNACMQAVCLGTLVTMVVAANLPSKPFDGNGAALSDETILLATQSKVLQTALPNVFVSSKAAVDSQQSAVAQESSLVDRMINPSQNATPETTTLGFIVTSPNYESDHTIMAAGRTGAANRVLFVSNDGGANWKPLPSLLFAGSQVVIPPGYPHDRRIFAFGELGLQQSDDGGEIFRTVSPMVGTGFAISPSFERGDSRVLMGARTIYEYDASTGVTRPGSLNLPLARGAYPFVGFSPGYPSDPTIFVSDYFVESTTGEDLLNPRYDETTLLYRCKESVCDEMRLALLGPLKLRLSPRFDQDGLAYAFTPRKLLASNDGGRTFREIQFPLPELGSIKDAAIWWDTSSDPAIFVSAGLGLSDVYRSLDAGRSWNRTRIGVPGFSYGAEKLIVTPTGRLLGAGSPGIACSEDGGQTWAPRCTPEP